MAGRIRQEPYPQPYGPDNPPPHIPGFTPEQDWAYAHPDAPAGYTNWTDYVLDVLDATDSGGTGPVPYNPWGQSMAGDMQPLEYLINNLGYGRLAPILDTSNPRIQQFLDSTYYSNTSYDNRSPGKVRTWSGSSAMGRVSRGGRSRPG
jgi:hypothetical protein